MILVSQLLNWIFTYCKKNGYLPNMLVKKKNLNISHLKVCLSCQSKILQQSFQCRHPIDQRKSKLRFVYIRNFEASQYLLKHILEVQLHHHNI